MESRAKLYGVFHAPAVKISTSRLEHRQDPCYAGCAEAKIVSDGVPSRGALRGLHPKDLFRRRRRYLRELDRSNTTVTI